MKFVFIFIIFTIVLLHIDCYDGSNFQSKTGNTTISGNRTSASYGLITGYASTNVPAYSNGNESYISDQWNYLYEVFTGMKWQCVEYARRWLFIRKGCVFDSVDGAADIWTQIKQVQRVVDGTCFNLRKYPNGSPSPPINQSLLIYNHSRTDFPFGHVSVIVDVLSNFIRFAEQNYDPYYWSGNYSRQIPYALKNGNYYIETDDPILGWMIVEDNNQTKALDQAMINAIIQLNGTSSDFICPNTITTTSTNIISNIGIYHRSSVSSYFFVLFLAAYVFINDS